MEVVRIVMLGMTGVLLGLFLKGTRPEYSVYLSLAAGILIFFYMTDKLSYLFSSVMKIQDYLPVDIEYLTTLLKIIGITYIGQFSSGICKDAGYGSIGAQIEIFTKLYIMVLSMPVLLALMEAFTASCHEKKEQTKEDRPSGRDSSDNAGYAAFFHTCFGS